MVVPGEKGVWLAGSMLGALGAGRGGDRAGEGGPGLAMLYFLA